MKKSKLAKQGKGDSAKLKVEIQRLVREIVMKRDGGCILRDKRSCGAILGHTGHVFQADHLITRANSATYADTRLIVCICRDCHGWKHWHKEEYDSLVKTVLSPERVELWERRQKESYHPAHKVAHDWKLEILALEQQFKAMLSFLPEEP